MLTLYIDIYAYFGYEIVYVLCLTPVAQWLRCCTTNRKVAGSIPVCVIGIIY